MDRSSLRRVAAAGSAVLAGGLLFVPPAHAAGEVTINLVAVADFHGQIEDNLIQWAGTVEQLLADGSADSTLLLAAGDSVGESSPASTAQRDNPAIDVLNALGVDASALGNHELDRGYDDFVNRTAARANFPIVGANVAKADGSPALDASTMLTAGGLRIAVIGAVTEETPQLLDPSGIAGLSFRDPIGAINAEVDRLNGLPASEQPDVIVAAIHDGAPWGTWSLEGAMQSSSFFARLVTDTSPDVDAIIAGHTHNTYSFDAPVPGDPSRTRPVIQPGYHARGVGQVKLTVDSETGDVRSSTARNVESVTTSEDDLIDTYPSLATVAQIRDEAIAFAAAQAAEAAIVKQDYYAAVATRDETSAKAEQLKQEYDATTAAGDDAFTTAAQIKARYDAAVAEGKAAYATAAQVKQRYDAAVAEGKTAYASAAQIKQAYLDAVAAGKAAYAKAAQIKQAYLDAVAAGKAAYAKAAEVKQVYDVAAAAAKEASATAAQVKQAYDAAVAEGKAAYETAAKIKQAYDAAVAEGRAAYETAAQTKQAYDAAVAAGDPDSQAAALAQQYKDAVAAGDAAYAEAAAMQPDYDAAIAAGKDAYTRANAMKPDFDAAMAASQEAYTRAAGTKQEYDAAIAAGKDAYTRAAAMKPDYDTAMAAGKDAYTRAAAMKPDYDTAMAAGNEAYEEASVLKQQFDAAMALLEATVATIEELREKLRLLNVLEL